MHDRGRCWAIWWRLVVVALFAIGGNAQAQSLKLSTAQGSAFPLGNDRAMEIRGRDLITGLPRSTTITSAEIREAIHDPVCAIVDAVKVTLETCPPELSADIMERGIVLAGGGALLEGLDKLLERETSMPVHIATDPLSCVVVGTGRVLEEIHSNPQLRKVLKSS